MIRRSTGRLQRIVEDLLLVAQIEAQRLELQLAADELGEIAAAAVEAARPAAEEKGIALELRRGEPQLLEADANGSARCWTTSSRTRSSSPTRRLGHRLDEQRGAAWARVTVTDNGVGIPADEQGQLFSRFFRASTATRRAIPGTGLGLVIARAIVDEHAGTISLESREGEGTRVTVALPLHRATSQRGAA